MTRNGLLVVLVLVTGYLLTAWADEPAKKADKKPESKEFIEQFMDSLTPKTPVSDESDRCPGETKADRDETASVEEGTCEDTSEEPIAEATDGEEPKTLPSGIDASPLSSPAKTEKLQKPAATKAEVHTVSDEEVDLSPEMLRLKEKLRATLAFYYDHPQRVTDRSPWGIMHWMLPFGVDSQVIDANGRRQNAVGYLCFNYPCKGQRLFYLKNNQLASDVGPGLQGHRGQFLAMLAQSKVDPAYPMKVDGRDFKVADLIEYEKKTCESNTELTFKLIALSHYLKHDEKWKNNRGEEWDIPRLIREELKAPVVGAACGGTHRMTGHSYAVRKHEARNLLIDGQWMRASKFIDSYHDYTFTLQNRDASFSTNWFASRGDLPDPQRRLQTSGHIVEWLVYSLPQERLNEKEVTRGVDYVTTLLVGSPGTELEFAL